MSKLVYLICSDLQLHSQMNQLIYSGACFAKKKTFKKELWRAVFLHNTMSSVLMSQLSPKNFSWSAVNMRHFFFYFVSLV